ncbi:hypothetical protein [Streptomyces sp. 8N616]|uniref:hypothetical protein n=1 Tax=Streptomyces sp. 8N616 TaxID=3457414 RepID=UPI003FD03E90
MADPGPGPRLRVLVERLLDRAVVFDHATCTTYLLALVEEQDRQGADETAARAWLNAVATGLRAIAGRCPSRRARPGWRANCGCATAARRTWSSSSRCPGPPI